MEREVFQHSFSPREQSSSIQPSSHWQTPGYMHTPFTHVGLQGTIYSHIYKKHLTTEDISYNVDLQSSSIIVTVADCVYSWYISVEPEILLIDDIVI